MTAQKDMLKCFDLAMITKEQGSPSGEPAVKLKDVDNTSALSHTSLFLDW